MLRNHGQSERNIVKHFGYLSRMDTLQAAVLSFRIKKLNRIIKAGEKMQITTLKILMKISIYYLEKRNLNLIAIILL